LSDLLDDELEGLPAEEKERHLKSIKGEGHKHWITQPNLEKGLKYFMNAYETIIVGMIEKDWTKDYLVSIADK
jgi:hypothetical protein